MLVCALTLIKAAASCFTILKLMSKSGLVLGASMPKGGSDSGSALTFLVVSHEVQLHMQWFYSLYFINV